MAKENSLITDLDLFQKGLRYLRQFYLYAVIFGIFCTQFWVDESNLPIGFESAKADFLFRLIGVFLIVYLPAAFASLSIRLLTRGSRKTWQKFRKSGIGGQQLLMLFLTALPLAALVSTLLSPYPEIAYTGNEFRFSGYYTWLLLYFVFMVLLLEARLIKLHFVLLGYIGIVSFHGLIGLNDALHFSFEVISQGYYVNGNYGQANFFGSEVGSVCVILTTYLIGLIAKKIAFKLKWAIVAIVLLAYNLFVLFLSFSYGAWLTLIVCSFSMVIVLFAPARLGLRKFLPEYSILLSLVLICSCLILISTWHIDPGRHDIWYDSLNLIKKRPFWGFGADTLAVAFRDHGLLKGHFVDRAHNLLLDILISWGLVSFATMVAAVIFLYRVFRTRVLTEGKLFIGFGAIGLLVVWLNFYFTSLLQTKSISQYAEFVVWSALLAAFFVNKKSRK